MLSVIHNGKTLRTSVLCRSRRALYAKGRSRETVAYIRGGTTQFPQTLYFSCKHLLPRNSSPACFYTMSTTIPDFVSASPLCFRLDVFESAPARVTSPSLSVATSLTFSEPRHSFVSPVQIRETPKLLTHPRSLSPSVRREGTVALVFSLVAWTFV